MSETHEAVRTNSPQANPDDEHKLELQQEKPVKIQNTSPQDDVPGYHKQAFEWIAERVGKARVAWEASVVSEQQCEEHRKLSEGFNQELAHSRFVMCNEAAKILVGDEGTLKEWLTKQNPQQHGDLLE